jgi:NAD(P)-dependent dehydrogenase (short-subunit alcohol dehydrogenase family)
MTSGELKKRTIIVTGANRGIGAEIALELARRGFHVACFARNGQAPATDDRELATRLTGIVCDVTDLEQAAEAIHQAANLPGPLFGLVNNAGILDHGPSASFPLATFKQIMDTNVSAAFSLAQLTYEELAANDGMIVNIGSFWGRLGSKLHIAYCTSKAAIEGLTRALAVEWAQDGIRVNCVAPGYVETDLNREILASEGFQSFIKKRAATQRPVPVGDIAKMVASLFSENLSGLTGETIYVDGGHSINN